jgi:hypothetical protein
MLVRNRIPVLRLLLFSDALIICSLIIFCICREHHFLLQLLFFCPLVRDCVSSRTLCWTGSYQRTGFPSVQAFLYPQEQSILQLLHHGRSSHELSLLGIPLKSRFLVYFRRALLRTLYWSLSHAKMDTTIKWHAIIF